MSLKIKDIPKKELEEFIRLMDGYCGIFYSDISWVEEKSSPAYKITLYCYLIASGELFVEDQKLKSVSAGYSELIDFIEEYFRGKCIVNFTDLFFLNEINQAFCGGSWGNIKKCWLVERPDVFIELASKEPKIYRLDQAYQIIVENSESDFDDLYFIKISNHQTTIIDFFADSITWREEPISIGEFKRMYNVGKKHYSIHPISSDEFFSYIMDLVEPEVGSLLN
jgi:hypothetical protein